MLYFGANIRYLRENDGHKIAEASAITGFPRSTWNGYETGDSFPSFKDLIKISDYFGILESDLLHTSIPGHDLDQLYNRYLEIRTDTRIRSDNPRSVAFNNFLTGDFKAIAERLSGRAAGESAAKPALAVKNKPAKPFVYNTADQHAQGLILNEPSSQYELSASKPAEERIAQLESILAQIKAIFNSYNL